MRIRRSQVGHFRMGTLTLNRQIGNISIDIDDGNNISNISIGRYFTIVSPDVTERGSGNVYVNSIDDVSLSSTTYSNSSCRIQYYYARNPSYSNGPIYGGSGSSLQRVYYKENPQIQFISQNISLIQTQISIPVSVAGIIDSGSYSGVTSYPGNADCTMVINASGISLTGVTLYGQDNDSQFCIVDIG